MLVDPLELVHICSMLEPELRGPGKASILKRCEAKWNAAREVPDLLSLLVSCTYSQSLLMPLVSGQPEGFRKCLGAGEGGASQTSSYFEGSCGVGKAYSSPMEPVQRRDHGPSPQRPGDLPVALPRI